MKRFLLTGFFVATLIAISLNAGPAAAQEKKTESKTQKKNSVRLLKKSTFEDNPSFVSTLMGLLRNPFVIQELDLVDYQKEDLKKIQYNWQKELNQIVRDTSGKRGKDRTEKVVALYSDLTKRIEAVLLKRQILRLRQITLQAVALKRRRSPLFNAAVLENPLVSNEIDISPVQKKKLQAKAKEIQLELKDKIKLLTDKANNELLLELEADQRKRFQKLVGDQFEFRKSNLNRRRH